MAGQYPLPMPPLGAFYPSGYPPMMPPPPPELFQSRLHQLQTYSMENLSGYSDVEDPNQSMLPPQQGNQRSRRRQPPGSEHVKHRRTRSGCYTCRQRRVKCDETRPTCDSTHFKHCNRTYTDVDQGCRKGKRECTYPGSSSSSKQARSSSRSKGQSADSGSSPSGDESDDDDNDKEALETIPDEGDESAIDGEEPSSATSASRNYSTASSVLNESPSTEAPSLSQRPVRPQASRTTSKQSVKTAISEHRGWASLSKDVKTYIRYHRDNMSYHHYAFKYDSGDFLKTTFIEIALNDPSQALLYAIVAFAAYHYTMARGDARISAFLQYYNRSIVLLQQSLKSKRPNVTTLLTILQLATIEEFLGDWVNLLGHQRAAHKILTDLYTPQTIMHDEIRRKIIAWYIRFDLFAGMMSGGATTISREWFAESKAFYSRQVRDRPDDLGMKFEEYFATSRLIATDVALLFAAKTQGTLSDEEFASSTRDLLSTCAAFNRTLDNAFADRRTYVKSFPQAPPPSEDDLTDFRDPNFLYGGSLFTMNFILMDFWSLELMFKHQLAMAQKQQPSIELAQLALKKCKGFEAIEYCGQGPPGAILGCQASLGIACLFLPKDQKHTNWCRRKIAMIEQRGFIYPATLRQRMSELWGVDVSHWWLDDDEGYLPVVRAVRDFIEYRARVPDDTMDAHVRDMSGIFRSLNVEEPSSAETESDQFSPHSQDLSMESSPDQTSAS